MRSFHSAAVAATLLAALATTSCLESDSGWSDAQEFRAALPVADSVQIDVPEDQQKALGELAEYYLVTLDTTRWLNNATVHFVALAHLLAAGVPSSVDDDSATWGPYRGDGLDPLEYVLEVERLDETRYRYAVSVRPKDDPSSAWVPVMSGENDPGDATRGAAGNIRLDFAARNAVAPVFRETGTIEAVYDLQSEPATNDIVFVEFVNERGEGPYDATYHYEVDAFGAGTFEFDVVGDVDGSPLAEDVHIVSSWQSDGAGRADITASGGDLGEVAADITECWDTSYLRVFYTAAWQSSDLDAPWLQSEGSGESCVF